MCGKAVAKSGSILYECSGSTLIQTVICESGLSLQVKVETDCTILVVYCVSGDKIFFHINCLLQS
jgi:hypothetical protein